MRWSNGFVRFLVFRIFIEFTFVFEGGLFSIEFVFVFEGGVFLLNLHLYLYLRVAYFVIEFAFESVFEGGLFVY